MYLYNIYLNYIYINMVFKCKQYLFFYQNISFKNLNVWLLLKKTDNLASLGHSPTVSIPQS